MTPYEVTAALKQVRDEREERIKKMREQAATHSAELQKLAKPAAKT